MFDDRSAAGIAARPLTRPLAVAFDCDGTLADTERPTHDVFVEVMQRYDYAFTEADFSMIVGRSIRRNHLDLAERAALPSFEAFAEEWYDVLHQHLDRELVLFDDAIDTLRATLAADIPVAVVSSSPREHVRRILRAAGVDEAIALVVGFEDVSHHKPHPEPYLQAAGLLGVDAAGCVAVEDTPTGVEAAAMAGMATVAVRRPGYDVGEFVHADVVVGRLALDDILRVSRMPG